jgi:hypothetical protein
MRKPTTTSRRNADLPDSMNALGVYVGSKCIGFLLPRGRQGVEAFGADDRSLGVFPDQKHAADAVSAAAGSTA